MIGIAVG